MNITIDPGSALELQLKMAGKANRVDKAIDTILKKAAFVVEKYGKLYSPVKTGRMRSSISEGIHFGDKFASVGPTVVYAKYVHAKIPFMWAAAESSRAEIKTITEQEINKAIK